VRSGDRDFRCAGQAETWAGCYDDGWAGLITAESFSHPAKMSRGLLVRIFDQLFVMDALKRGDLVVDPFAGIGTTGIEAASRGCLFIGCELEPRFVALARANNKAHAATWAAMGRPQPVMVEGDSRRLRACIGPALAEAVVSSPPYEADTVNARNGIDMARTRIGSRFGGPNSQARAGGYGTSSGQLGAMKAGDVAAVVSSPPYISGGHHTDQTGAWNTNRRGQRGGGSPTKETAGYGKSAGQLARLPNGAFADAPESAIETEYPTFWTESAKIVRESHAILKPGGLAVWVVKAFVRDKQIVDFPGDWRKLCEACGFELVKEVHAMLVVEERVPHLWDGERVTKRARKSFFRRLAESKGSPPIDFETVLFMRRTP